MYRPLFAYKSTSETPYKINLDKSLGTVPEVSEDGKTYTIKLRDDAKWSDGTPVSTRDIEFWWNLVTNNKDEWASYKEGFFPRWRHARHQGRAHLLHYDRRLLRPRLVH